MGNSKKIIAPNKIVATYDYVDESGVHLFQSLRYEPKGFNQRRSDGIGGWEWNLNGVRRVPYRLPELLAADLGSMVFIVEGEKDVERLRLFGLVATTNPGGAGKWRDDYSEFLRDRIVCILPDNDSPGRDHAVKIAHSLQAVAASIRILELPGLPSRGDVSDWLQCGGTPERLQELAASVPELSLIGPTNDHESKRDSSSSQLIRMADVEAEEVTWLWYPFIPAGKLTIVEGDPGVGKSWLLCSINAAITTGTGLPNECQHDARNALMLSAEDGIADTLKPRVEALRADSGRVFTFKEPLILDEAGLLRLEAAIMESDAAIVTIDPLFGFAGSNVDIHRANECRSITSRLAMIAEKHKCAIVAVRHLAKSRGNGHALNAGIGSIDITAAARSVLLVGKDPNQENNRAIIQIKNNLAPIGPAVGFMLRDGQLSWTGESDLTAQNILMDFADATQRSALDEAISFLREALADAAREVNEVRDEAKQAGIAEQTLRRAREQLGIKAKREGQPGTKQRFFWSLSNDDVQDRIDKAQKEQNERHRKNNKPKATHDGDYLDDVQIVELEHNPISDYVVDVQIVELEHNPISDYVVDVQGIELEHNQVSRRTNGLYS